MYTLTIVIPDVAHSITYFIPGSLKHCNILVGGYSQGMKVKKTGKFEWGLPDKEGSMNTINIPNTLYDPQSCSRFLSPQHWGHEEIKMDRGKSDV